MQNNVSAILNQWTVAHVCLRAPFSGRHGAHGGSGAAKKVFFCGVIYKATCV